MAYLLARMVWITVRGPSRASPPVWPVWLLAALTVFLAGFRVGLNVQDSNVIDVGYASVIGAQRIANGEMPYGHMPVEGDLKKCGAEDADGRVRERVQTNGRCESANERGDTYGPVAYEAYVPGYAVFGWSGRWDKLPAAHATAIAFDLITIFGLMLVGLRFGGHYLGAALPFAWAANPFTQYVSNSNTNDAIMPALLVFGFWLVTSPWGRGIFLALGGLDEVRRPAARAALGLLRRASCAQHEGAVRRRLRARNARLLLDPLPRAGPLARRARVLGPHLRLAGRPRLAVLDLGLGPVPRRGHPGPRQGAARGHPAAGRRLGRDVLLAAPQDRRCSSLR